MSEQFMKQQDMQCAVLFVSSVGPMGAPWRCPQPKRRGASSQVPYCTRLLVRTFKSTTIFRAYVFGCCFTMTWWRRLMRVSQSPHPHCSRPGAEPHKCLFR